MNSDPLVITETDVVDSERDDATRLFCCDECGELCTGTDRYEDSTCGRCVHWLYHDPD